MPKVNIVGMKYNYYLSLVSLIPTGLRMFNQEVGVALVLLKAVEYI